MAKKFPWFLLPPATELAITLPRLYYPVREIPLDFGTDNVTHAGRKLSETDSNRHLPSWLCVRPCRICSRYIRVGCPWPVRPSARDSLWQFTLGMYLICLGVNYAAMLVYAVAIRNKQNAHSELGDELADKQAAMAKYRRLSVLLLVPLLVPVLALSWGRSWSLPSL